MSNEFETKYKIIHRNDTYVNWMLTNPVLAEGEIAITRMEDGDRVFKLGNGVDTYDKLPNYITNNNTLSDATDSEETTVGASSLAVKLAKEEAVDERLVTEEQFETGTQEVLENLIINAYQHASLTGINAQAKSLVAELGMPNGLRKETIAFVTSIEYTAPANGYVQYASTVQGSSGSGFLSSSSGLGTASINTSSIDNFSRVFLPVKKGDVVLCQPYLPVGAQEIIFIYAEGEGNA